MKTNIDIFDLTKLILSIMIVLIHTLVYSECEFIYPWVRVAIPLFFMISSYLLEYRVLLNETNKRKIIEKYVVRLLKLSLFWTVVTFPMALYLRRGLFKTPKVLLANIIKALLYGEMFRGQWYIYATIVSILIVYLVFNRIDERISLSIYLFMYLICCLRSGYSSVWFSNELLRNIANYYEKVLPIPYLSFLSSLLWIDIGKIVAKNKIKITNKCKSTIIIFLLLLYAEWKYSCSLGNDYNSDCLFMLIPCCILLFLIIKDIEIELKNSQRIRNYSTILYCSHGFISSIFAHFLNEKPTICSIICFFSSIIIAFLIYMFIDKYKNKYPVLINGY